MSSTIFSSKEVKIRKACRCWGCGDRHEKGDQMHVTKGIFDNSFFSTYWCSICWDFQQTKGFTWSNYDDGDGGVSQNCFEQDRAYEKFRRAYIDNFGIIKNLKSVLV